MAGSWDSDGAPDVGPVGVDGAGGRDSDMSDMRAAVGVVGVLDLELLKSFLPPLTLVRLVPAAANNCCCAGVNPDTPLLPPPMLSLPVLQQ